MENQANQNSLRDYRPALLVSGVIVGMIILLFILHGNDISFQQMFDGISMRSGERVASTFDDPAPFLFSNYSTQPI